MNSHLVLTVSGTFISYRDDDAKAWALLLRDELADAFGEGRVFLDKDDLRAGKWEDQLQVALERCGAVLVVVGRRWLSALNPEGVRRLDDPRDVHRREIATALARKGVTVIPVLVDGATMPKPQQLPDDIRALTDRQARSLGDRSAHRRLDLDELIRDIELATGETASADGKTIRRPRLRMAWVSRLAVVLASIYIGIEIDYRHWSWVLFLVVVPGVALAPSVVAWQQARVRGQVALRKREDSQPT